MRAGFISTLFVSLAGFGIWFQQSYMEVYSQEFELELRADRTKAELMSARGLDVHEYRSGVRSSSFQGKELRLHNNGQLVASGNLRYVLHDAQTGKPHSEFTSGRMVGQLQLSAQGTSPFDTKNRMEYVQFPGEVVATALEDRIEAKSVRFEPEAGTIFSQQPVNWTGPGRSFHGTSFRYSLKADELSVGGPLRGNFIPGKDDFKEFKSMR